MEYFIKYFNNIIYSTKSFLKTKINSPFLVVPGFLIFLLQNQITYLKEKKFYLYTSFHWLSHQYPMEYSWFQYQSIRKPFSFAEPFSLLNEKDLALLKTSVENDSVKVEFSYYKAMKFLKYYSELERYEQDLILIKSWMQTIFIFSFILI